MPALSSCPFAPYGDLGPTGQDLEDQPEKSWVLPGRGRNTVSGPSSSGWLERFGLVGKLENEFCCMSSGVFVRFSA